MARITPATPTRGDGSGHEEWIYRLEPSQELPVLDLSVSVKSRFLSAKGLARFDRFITHRKLLFYGISIAMLMYPASLLIDKRIGKWLAVATSLIGLPAALVGGSLLRYNVITLLLTTYDVWYFTIMNTATLLVLGMSLGDVRAVSMLITWVGFQPMVLIDSNLRAIRRLTQISVMGIFGMAFFMVLVAFNRIEGIVDFVLFRFKSHVFYAKSFVNNGLLTLIMLLARNVIRNRGHFCTRKKRLNAGAVMECVSYRCRLRLSQTRSPRESTISSAVSLAASLPQNPRPVYMQKVRYVPRIKLVDARRTVFPFPFTDSDSSSSISRYRWIRLLFTLFWCISSVSSVIMITLDIHWKAQNIDTGSGVFSLCRTATLILTIVHCAISFGLLQRKLLAAILKSFDFAFFSVHITILHLCMADFFYWRKSCSTLLVTWLWLHWALCLDALTPVVRFKIGFHVRLVAPLIVLGFVAPSLFTLYIIVTAAANATDIQDRVILEWEIFHTLVRVHVTPIFYNCVPTAFALLMRFTWRLCTYANDELLLLDGKVVYDNYFRKTRNRKSRRRSDDANYIPATAVLPDRESSLASEQSMKEDEIRR
ncbi:hypothetical protein Gpo141_00006205 [Globisporangium polare]